MSAAPTRYHTLHVRAVVDETYDTKSIIFDVPPDLVGRYQYRPGQFLTLRLPVGDRHVPRCYSMSSAPALDSGLRVTVKRVPGGRGSNWICDQIRAGSPLETMPPSGVFTPRNLDGDFLLFAGGSGITPVFSILRSVLASGAGKICLIYANRDERSIIFRRELDDLVAAHPARLNVVHWLDAVQGIPTIGQMAALARPWRDAQAFICGPASFMDVAVASLNDVAMASERIHLERFISLPDEEDAVKPDAAPSDSSGQTQVEMSLDGVVHTVQCLAGETLLEAAIRQGVNAPFSCQAGMCASCMCRVVEGEVHLRHNEVLDQKDLSGGWTLSCQAVPLGSKVRIKFPE